MASFSAPQFLQPVLEAAHVELRYPDRPRRSGPSTTSTRGCRGPPTARTPTATRRPWRPRWCNPRHRRGEARVDPGAQLDPERVESGVDHLEPGVDHLEPGIHTFLESCQVVLGGEFVPVDGRKALHECHRRLVSKLLDQLFVQLQALRLTRGHPPAPRATRTAPRTTRTAARGDGGRFLRGGISASARAPGSSSQSFNDGAALSNRRHCPMGTTAANSAPGPRLCRQTPSRINRSNPQPDQPLLSPDHCHTPSVLFDPWKPGSRTGSEEPPSPPAKHSRPAWRRPPNHCHTPSVL